MSKKIVREVNITITRICVDEVDDFSSLVAQALREHADFLQHKDSQVERIGYQTLSNGCKLSWKAEKING